MANCSFARTEDTVTCTVCGRRVKTAFPPERVYATCLVGDARRPWGPGSELRKILGCSAKDWPHYQEMNRLGPLCRSRITDFAASLVACGHIASQRAAERLIRRAIDQSSAKA